MAKLIDDLIKELNDNLIKTKITNSDGYGWFFAKPIPFKGYSWSSFKSLISDLWRIIVGKGFVVYYKEDEK
jgi:hypothetical protein